MLELAGFNYSKDDNTEFIATLLLDHAIERPWVIEAPFMDNVSHILRNKNTTEPKSLSSSLCISHTDCSNLSTLFQRHGVETVNYPWSTLKLLMCATVTLPQIPVKSWNESLVFNIDSHLEIFGVILFSVGQFLPAVPGARQSLSSINIISFKQTFLREFQGHVNFEHLPDYYRSYRARVSFQSKDGSFSPLVNRISSMIRQLESAISLCQSNGKCLLGIYFLIRADLAPENSAEDESSIATLAIATITRFFQSFKKLAERCGQQDAKPAEHSPTPANVVETTLSVALAPSTGLSDLVFKGHGYYERCEYGFRSLARYQLGTRRSTSYG